VNRHVERRAYSTHRRCRIFPTGSHLEHLLVGKPNILRPGATILGSAVETPSDVGVDLAESACSAAASATASVRPPRPSVVMSCVRADTRKPATIARPVVQRAPDPPRLTSDMRGFAVGRVGDDRPGIPERARGVPRLAMAMATRSHRDPLSSGQQACPSAAAAAGHLLGQIEKLVCGAPMRRPRPPPRDGLACLNDPTGNAFDAVGIAAMTRRL